VRRVTGDHGGVFRRALRAGRGRRDDDRGAITVIVAAMLVVMIGLAALVVDQGLAADGQRQAQSAADASALAAALALSRGGTPTDAVTAAQAYAQANFGVTAAEWAGCTAPLQPGFAPVAGTTCIAQNPTTKSVRVTLPSRRIASVFGGIFGVSSRTVTTAATAGFGNAGIADCVLCILDRLNGGVGGIQVTGGDVIGDKLDFNNVNGSIEVAGGGIGFATRFTAAATYTPAVPQKVTGFKDPYAGLALPPLTNTVAVSGANDCTPGNYTDIDNCKTIAPGIYVITDDRNNKLPVSPSGGVMFFFTCSDAAGRPKYCPAGGGKGGTFEAAGNGSFTLTGLNDPTSPYNNFAIFVDPNNTNQQKWAGKATLNVTGVVYDANKDPNGGFSDRGSGQLTVQGRVVLGYMELKGSGTDKVHVNVAGPAPAGSPSALTVTPRLSQ
jgi:Flp pilus assembly protein TadG